MFFGNLNPRFSHVCKDTYQPAEVLIEEISRSVVAKAVTAKDLATANAIYLIDATES